MTTTDATSIEFATLVQADRPRLHYALSGAATGQPIVFLHGYSDSWFSYSRLLPRLPADTFRAIALSQRGHGDSERPVGAYAIDQFADDVIALLDALDIDRATVVGHSMGSIIARRVAETRPARVAGLVLIGAVETPMTAVANELLAAIQAFGDTVPEDFVREFQVSTIHQPVPDAFLERVIAESMKLPARVWREVMQGLLDADDAHDLRRISAPTLLLWGEHDAYFPRAEQDRLVAAIPGARLVVYPETGHSPQWERPSQVAGDLENFMLGVR